MQLFDIPHPAHSVWITGLKPGQHYIAQGTGPARLLTCKRVDPDCRVVPVEKACSYLSHDCYLVTKDVFNANREKAEANYKHFRTSGIVTT